jgi:chromosome segregation ATPase
MKGKEKELVGTLQAQKDEYDRILKQRDEEVTAFVDGVVRENQALKKQIVSLEIDLEYYKEQLKSGSEGSSPTSDGGLDRRLYENLRIIKEGNDVKQKEILDKYEKILRGLTKDIRSQVSGLKRTSLDSKNRILNGDEEDEFIAFSQIEEQFGIFENRIRLLYEELKNKEKYILVVEQKYDMVNEETKYFKKKICEEKAFFQKKIDEIRNEGLKDHDELKKRVEKEILEKKENLQFQIDTSLQKNSEFINLLVNEKNRLKEELETQKVYIAKLEKEGSGNKREKGLIDNMKNRLEQDVTDFNEKKINKEGEIRKLINEIEILRKSNDDLTLKLNDLIEKNLKLEKLNKSLTQGSDEYKLTEMEGKYKAALDKLSTENLTLEKQARLESSENIRLKSQVEKLTSDNDGFRTDIGNKTLEVKHLNRTVEEFNEQIEKLKRQLNNEREKFGEKDNEYKELREKLMIKETELKTLKIENERILDLKEKHFNKSKPFI